jgi:hypothetical protein
MTNSQWPMANDGRSDLARLPRYGSCFRLAWSLEIGHSVRISRMLKKPFSPRLLKKVQIQGGVTHPEGWVPAEGVPTVGGSRRTCRVRRSAAGARQRRRWAFFSGLLVT